MIPRPLLIIAAAVILPAAAIFETLRRWARTLPFAHLGELPHSETAPYLRDLLTGKDHAP